MIDIDVHKANYDNYSKKQLLRIIGELQDKTYRLEKALDKACNELYINTLFIKDLGVATIGLEKDSFNKKDWREWCLEDVE